MIVTLYAHDDPEEIEEYAQDAADKAGADVADVLAIFKRKPLYEVEFDFDVETGKCVAVRVEGQSFVRG